MPPILTLDNVPMHIIAWNILAGGGRRVPQIAERLLRDNPDVVVLGEYHHRPPGKELIRLLEQAGFAHQALGSTDPAQRSVALLSRRAFEVDPFPEWPTEQAFRVISARFDGARVIATYFPAKPPFIARMFEPLMAATPRLRDTPTLLVGDLNAGANPADTQGSALTAGDAFDGFCAAGWQDLWRRANPDAAEFTWYSPGAGNGFRLDHALLLAAEPDAASRCTYDHAVREARLSDHSLLEVRWAVGR